MQLLRAATCVAISMKYWSHDGRENETSSSRSVVVSRSAKLLQRAVVVDAPVSQPFCFQQLLRGGVAAGELALFLADEVLQRLRVAVAVSRDRAREAGLERREDVEQRERPPRPSSAP